MPTAILTALKCNISNFRGKLLSARYVNRCPRRFRVLAGYSSAPDTLSDVHVVLEYSPIISDFPADLAYFRSEIRGFRDLVRYE